MRLIPAPSRHARALLSSMVAITLVAGGAMWGTPASAVTYTPGTVTSTDMAAGAQPEMKFTYTVATPRAADDNLFILNKPTGYTFTAKTNSELKAMTTIKINGVTKTPGIFDTSIGAIWSGGIQIRLETGYTLSAGDEVEITIAAGGITNPATTGDVTWQWRTSDPSANANEWFSATVTIEAATTTTTSTTSTSTTSTTSTSTTVASTTTAGSGTTTSVAGATTTVATTDTALAPEPLEDKELPNLAAGGSAFTVDGKDTPLVVTGSGGRVNARAGAFSLSIAGSRNGSAVPLGVGAAQTLPAGSQLSVSGQGFKPGTAARLWLVNGKALLGNATVGADGSVVLSGGLASSLAPGTYTIQVAGTGADGKVRAVSLGFTITAPADGDLTSTGGRSDLWTLMAIALVLMGIVATNGRIVRDEA